MDLTGWDWVTPPVLWAALAALSFLLAVVSLRFLWLKRELRLMRREFESGFEEWRRRHERAIRKDAVQRSQAVTRGMVTEHLIPYLPDFDYNPKDARFIGSPVDFLVFDGLDDDQLDQILFVEVKTGASTLNARERRVRDAVRARRVEWVELRAKFPTD